MVFGWGRKKPKKQEPDIAPQKKQILLSDVSNIVNEIRSIRTKTIIAETKTFRNKINSSCETILHIAIDLEHDTLKIDDIDIHLKRLVERGKKEVISVIKRESSVQLPEINSYNDVKIFNTSANKLLKKIGDALGRQSRVIHIFAKKYANKLKDDLKVMTDGNDEITTIIMNHSELETKIEQIFEIGNKIERAKKLIIDLSEQQKLTKKTINDLVATIERDEKGIENIKNSSEYTEFLEIKQKINSLSSEKNKIKNEIELQFTKISRPLNKYVYVSSLDKPQKKLLVNLIENSYDVLIDSNRQDIMQILESTRKGIQSGSVSVKDVDKSLSQIDETLSLLPGFIEKISAFHRSKSDIESKLSTLDNKQLRQMESILNTHQNDKSILESKTNSAEKELVNTTEFIPKWIKSLESILNQISAVQYTIRS
uniref:Exonuclease SbcC n=1 Tax=uncultured marine crenarchaeote AD1000-207-H3 TaxID=526637 RepID=B3V6A6_9ARCH|nr:hypothetical protein [uncultured marine crenarchaeote AD1000-207-H3]